MDGVYELCAELIQNLSEQNEINEKEQSIEAYIDLVLSKVGVVKDFQDGLEWFNVTEALSLRRELAGKLVLLDFFTYCCINCLHVLPELKFIENKYSVKDGLVVVGVHSAKFDAEKGSASVAAAIQRHEITHPVVNDVSCAMWQNLNIVCWPTLLLLSPEGHPLFLLMGEGHLALLDLFVRISLKYFTTHRKIVPNELPQITQSFRIASGSILKFPGRVSLRGDYLAVSDTGHNRILIVNINTGIIKFIVGSGGNGLLDGTFEMAKFSAPQGLVWLNEKIIYVADTENHVVRKIDLQENQVKTIAGTGQMGTDREGKYNVATLQPLSSPWGLEIDPSHKVLLVAMAGTHQIWGLVLHQVSWWKGRELQQGVCVALAGSGREENRNGSYPMAAGFAQPSGLALAGQSLLVADSESSSIRKINLAYGKVEPVVGGEKDPLNLFSFGDVDSKGTLAKLQHPLDLAWSENQNILYVADTFNHKIKKVNLETATCETLHLIGEAKTLCEPGGLCVDDSRGLLIIADTNNHAIKVVELRNNNNTTKLILEYPTEVDLSKRNSSVQNIFLSKDSGSVKLCLKAFLPVGSKPTLDAPQTWKLKQLPDMWSASSLKGNWNISHENLEAEVYLHAPPGSETVLLDLTTNLVSCSDASGQCRMHQLSSQVLVQRSDTQHDHSITIIFNV